MFKYQDFLNLGKHTENQIAKKLAKFVQSDAKQDIAGVDLSLTLTFDVKSAKKIRRGDFGPSYNRTWIEYRNVKGELGSLCKDNLDFFIIETIDSWVVKSRLDAFEMFKCKSKLSETEYKPLIILTPEIEIELYQPYQRKGRKDVIMLVEINDDLWPTLLKLPKN